MALISIERPAPRRRGWALWDLGFRPFFFGAALFAAIAMALWMAVYVFRLTLPFGAVSPSQWHAHEMIYGYAMAVIAGFLLTAVQNWTGIPTPRGGRLTLLFLLWAGARLLYAFGLGHIRVAAAFDLAFIASLAVIVISRVVRTRQWRQLAIVAKLVFLSIGQVLFVLGALGRLEKGIYWGLYGGLYLVISLIMTMGARIIPPFIQNGVGYEVRLWNPKGINLSSLVLFVAFFVVEVFSPRPLLTAALTAALFAVTTARLVGWHTRGLWRKPLLWSLYLSFAAIDGGFLLFTLSPFLGFTKLIAIHAMTVGGIGLVTAGMMARVSLGHSGRNVREARRLPAVAFAGIGVAALLRVAGPLIRPNLYVRWVAAAQLVWIVSFLLFAAAFIRVWATPGLSEE